MFRKGRIDVISLGCSKNLVDSERLLKLLEAKGYKTFHDPEKPQGEIVVVNTCGFIADAKEESINTILSLAELKKKKSIGKLIVMGCLSQRYMEDLKTEISEVDEWYGKFDWNTIIENLPEISQKTPSPITKIQSWERKLTTPPHSTYIKISEGCNRHCAFCAIPIITGHYKSRPIENILQEVEHLTKNGVKEFNIIAQDLSSYGLDLYKRHVLAELIDRMAEISGVEWIRLHYAYPADFPMDILDVMLKRDNICHYLDIALQHISDPVLRNMNRHIDKKETLELLKKIREKVPDIRIRTTLMTGFPGEGDKEFEELVEFVKTQRFDRMGAFAYSEEEDTLAAKRFEDNIPEEEKQKRLDDIMALQQEISLEINEKMVGSIQKVLIDRIEGNLAIGRTQYDSPEVDPEVIVKNVNLKPGDFVTVRIIKAYPFELEGVVETSISDIINETYKKNLCFFAYRLPGEKESKFGTSEGYIEGLYEPGFVISFFDPMLPVFTIPFENKKFKDFSDLRSYSFPNSSTSKEEYEQEVSEIVAGIDEGKWAKVVASRIKILENEINPGETYSNLCSQNKNTFVFCFYTPLTGFWIASSPELLLKGKGKHLFSMALAGTIPVTKENAGLSFEEKWDTKNIEEQKIVTEYICDIFKKHNILPQTKSLTELRAGKVSHLCTPIEAILPDKLNPENLEGLLKNLSPTPALSGYPKQEALQFIKSHEKFDRGCYGGFCGPYYGTDDFYFGVNLRCAVFRENKTGVFAGGGITSLSKPEEEWIETENKLQTMLDGIICNK